MTNVLGRKLLSNRCRMGAASFVNLLCMKETGFSSFLFFFPTILVYTLNFIPSLPSSLQEIILLTDVFPSFEWYFAQLLAMDAEFANMSLKTWIR